MKKPYTKPELVEYGRVDDLTLGATGSQLDIVIYWTQLTISISNNGSCTNNVNPSAGCFQFGIQP